MVSKKKELEIDEGTLMQTMLGDAPALQNGERPLAPSSAMDSPNSPETKQDEAEPEPKHPRRGPYRPRKPKEDSLYREMFLVNDGGRARVSAYINRDVHEKFKRLLSIIAPEITISSFINNILNQHLEQYRHEISEMYKNEFDKPF